MVKRKQPGSTTEHQKADVASSIHDFTDEERSKFRDLLVSWYNISKRDLPWRTMAKTPDINQRAYADEQFSELHEEPEIVNVWVSEVMLQQTQVATVISYYNKWMKKWPTLQDLATANIEEVNEMWSGLGYYSRGRRLYEGAKKVVDELEGEMPKTADTLLKQLPGVGRYTAGAIASIAYNQVTGLVDGNVIRVLCRMRGIGADSTSQVVQDKLWEYANNLVDTENPGDFNQGLMELGATVCSPKSPGCDKCPVSSLCIAYKKVEQTKLKLSKRIVNNNNSTAEIDIECLVDSCPYCFGAEDSWDSSLGVQNYPRKGKKKPPREERTAVCVLSQLCQNNTTQYLLVQRPKKGLLAGLWEFPSVILKESEDKSVEELLETACSAKVSKVKNQSHVGEVVHIFSHIHQTYVVESATIEEGEITLDEEPPTRWVTKEEFLEAGVSTAMKKVFKAYESVGSNKGTPKVKKNPGKTEVDNKQRSISSFFKPKS